MTLTFDLPVLRDEIHAPTFAPGLGFRLPVLRDEIIAPTFGIPTGPHPVDGQPPSYEAKIVRWPHWDVVVTIPDLTVENVAWAANISEGARFTFPKNKLSPGILKALGDRYGPLEVQLWLDGDILTWGPCVDLTGSGSDPSVHAVLSGADYPLHRRNIDAPEHNHARGGDFETDADMDAWPTGGPVDTAEITADNHYTGTHALRLTNSTPDGDAFKAQNFAVGPNGVGIYLTIAARYFLESITGPAFAGRGLYVETRTAAGDFVANNLFTIDTTTEAHTWDNKASTFIRIPPNERLIVNVRLYAPVGSILWDDVKILEMDSLATPGGSGGTFPPEDIGLIAGQLVRHVQSVSMGKSDSRIGTRNALVGVSQARAWQFVDHTSFDSALGELQQREDGLDWWMAYTPTTRTFVTSAGKRGVNRYDTVQLRFTQGDTSSNCADFDIEQAGASVFTRETVTGSDAGLDRDVGEAVDASPLGGLVLEDIYQAPQDARADSLLPIAKERVARNNRVPDVITFKLKPAQSLYLVHVLRWGDMIRGTVNDDFWRVDKPMRIQRIEFDGVKNQLSVTAATGDSL